MIAPVDQRREIVNQQQSMTELRSKVVSITEHLERKQLERDRELYRLILKRIEHLKHLW